VLNVPREEKPTVKQISVTVRSPRRSSIIARPTSYALIDPTEKAWAELSEVVRRAAEVES
jgi:hypothetical protein